MQDTKEQIILLLSNMLSSCEEVVKKSSEELKLLCDDPEYVVGLSRVINSKYSCILRQGAGSILSMQLMVASDWESVPSKNQAEIQTELLGALKSLMNDDSEELLLVVVRNVSLLLGLEQGATTGRQWSEEVFNYIESVCLSSNIKEQNMGAAIYNSLADVAPKVLPKYMKRGQKIFMSGILLAEERGCLVTPYTELLISGLTRALPLGHKYLSMTINPVLPSVMRVVTAFAYLPNLEKCDRGFDLMSNLLQYKPKLIWRQLPCVLEHLFLLASDNNLADAMRNKAIVYIRRLIEAKRRKITKMNMLDPLILVLLRVIAADSAYDAPEDEEMQSDDLPPTPVYTAAEALSFLVSESHSNKIAPRVFRLLRPQMEEESTQAQRVGVYLTLIVLSESFTEVLLKDNMLEFISICHAGISDDDSMVRRSACFSMSSMVTHFMPEITIMVDTVMPMFFEFLEHMTETQRFAAKESAVNECVFNTLEVYVENVTAECMKPHLQKLIPLLLLCTEPEQNSVSLRQLSLSVIAKTAEHMKTYLDNYFEDIVSVIRPLMVQTELKQELVLSAHAIHVCSALSLVSQSKFSSMALWILEVVMEMLSDSTDTQFSTDQISRLGGNGDQTDSDEDESCSDDEDKQSNSSQLEDNTSESSYDSSHFERENAIQCIKKFIVNFTDLMEPHMAEIVSLLLKWCKGGKSLAACDAICALVDINWKAGHITKAKTLVTNVLPNLIRHVLATDQAKDVIEALRCIHGILINMKCEAISHPYHADRIYCLVKTGLRRKLICQEYYGSSSDEENDDMIDFRRSCEKFSTAVVRQEQIMQVLADLLIVFSQCVSSLEFLYFFRGLSSRYMRQLRKLRKSSSVNEMRSFMYYTLTRCVNALGSFAEEYYEMMCKSIVYCILSRNPRVRQHGTLSLNHLIAAGAGKAVIEYTTSGLVLALQKHSKLTSAEKEGICGSISRIIAADRSNTSKIEQLMPALILNLPFHQDFVAHGNICELLKLLISDKSPVIQQHTARIVAVLMKSLENESIDRNQSIGVLKSLANTNPKIYEEFSKGFPEMSFLIR